MIMKINVPMDEYLEGYSVRYVFNQIRSSMPGRYGHWQLKDYRDNEEKVPVSKEIFLCPAT